MDLILGTCQHLLELCEIHGNPIIPDQPHRSRYAMAMFVTLPSTIMEAAFGRLHNSGAGAAQLLWNL